VKEHADALFIRMSDARDASSLPDGPDREKAEDLLVYILQKHLTGTAS
jgi:hypothetical protein